MLDLQLEILQREGVDYEKTFASVARGTSIKIILSLA
jgi:hypothetical protein